MSRQELEGRITVGTLVHLRGTAELTDTLSSMAERARADVLGRGQ